MSDFICLFLAAIAATEKDAAYVSLSADTQRAPCLKQAGRSCHIFIHTESYCWLRNFTESALWLVDFTTGGELHPALKILSLAYSVYSLGGLPEKSAITAFAPSR